MAGISLRTKNKPKKAAPVKIGKGFITARSANTSVKDLIPRDADMKYYGIEPNFSEAQPDADKRSLVINQSYNWYSHFYTYKDAKEMLVRYLEDQKTSKDTLKDVRRASDNKMNPSAGWLSRMALRGLILDEQQTAHIEKTVQKLVNSVKEVQEEKAELKVGTKVNVQEIMRDRASDTAGELDAIYDEFAAAKYPKEFPGLDKRVTQEFQSLNILPQHVPNIVKRWERQKNECEELIAGKDEQLNEAYAHVSKTQQKNMLKFINQMIDAINGYVSFKQATRQAKPRKAVPVEKTVAKLKYLKTFKDVTQKLDLVSVSPVKLHNSTEAWVYDTKKRRLYHYVADTYSNCLIVKGNTILGFDKKESGSKMLRRPTEQIAGVSGSKPVARKYFEAIKAVSAVPNGRFNADMIILRAF